MSAVISSCSGCGLAATSPSCQACGTVLAAPASAPGVLRGKVLRDTNAGPGMLSVDGRQLPFTLEAHWRGASAPLVNMHVDAGFDASGNLASVMPVSDSVIAREGLAEVGGKLAGLASHYAPAGRQFAGQVGKPVLAATAVLAVCWLWLPALSVRLNAMFAQDLSLYQVLALANSAQGFDGLGMAPSGGSGLLGLLATAATLAPLAAAFVRHRLAPLALFAPLAFMLLAGVAGWLKLRSFASQAVETARAFGGRQSEGMVEAMLAQVAKAVSLGYGTYIALAAALLLAWIGLRRLAQRS